MKYNKDIKTIDEYIEMFPLEVQNILKKIRITIQEAAPQATEAIRYGMPTFRLHGNMVHFAAHKEHIGFYPAPSGIINFTEELKAYNTSKGTIQFDFNKPIPYNLIQKIVIFRVAEQNAKK
jgi:uncharacterized protein YdhG (YjbR/CyaY superfamily)